MQPSSPAQALILMVQVANSLSCFAVLGCCAVILYQRASSPAGDDTSVWKSMCILKVGLSVKRK
jgi:hypothetical protein